MLGGRDDESRATRRAAMPGPPFGLRVRMLVAVAVQALLVCAVLGLLGYVFVIGWQLGLLVLLMASMAFTVGTRGERSRARKARAPQPADEARVDAAVTRLAIAGGLRAPSIDVQRAVAPLSWTTARPRGRPKLHVTTGLLDRVGDPELEAVVAHELGHIANRDAALMTILAGPAMVMLGALRGQWRLGVTDDRRGFAALAFSFPLFAPLGALLTLSGRIVSRHRELAADRTAVALTGSPAALATALLRLDESLEAIPERDLRVVASRDPFHVLPAREARGLRRLWATHPRTETRVEILRRMEARLQRP